MNKWIIPQLKTKVHLLLLLLPPAINIYSKGWLPSPTWVLMWRYYNYPLHVCILPSAWSPQVTSHFYIFPCLSGISLLSIRLPPYVNQLQNETSHITSIFSHPNIKPEIVPAVWEEMLSGWRPYLYWVLTMLPGTTVVLTSDNAHSAALLQLSTPTSFGHPHSTLHTLTISLPAITAMPALEHQICI